MTAVFIYPVLKCITLNIITLHSSSHNTDWSTYQFCFQIKWPKYANVQSKQQQGNHHFQN